MIAHGLPIYVALEPVDMRLGSERLAALVRERMRAEPRSRALFVFVGKRGQSMKGAEVGRDRGDRGPQPTRSTLHLLS
jgi:transposase